MQSGKCVRVLLEQGAHFVDTKVTIVTKSVVAAGMVIVEVIVDTDGGV